MNPFPVYWGYVLSVLLLATGELAAEEAPRRVAKWSLLEIGFPGPESQGRGKPNPFSIRLDVLFTSPSGRQFLVPGFYDGDGHGHLDGNVWKVRFSADELGWWSYRTRAEHPLLNGHTGRFRVVPVPRDARGFWKWGRLEAVGTAANRLRYLKFRDGPYWLKTGCDDPENFLGNFRHYNTPSKRRAAIDYLAHRGVNSLYLVLHNIDGDHRDVWPWLGTTPAEAKKHAGSDARFDLRRLEQWRHLLEYMQTRGVVPHLVLEDDSAWSGYDHARYYRELIARFGYLPALLFNLGEESNENYSLAQALHWAEVLARVDPYDHPRGVHNVNSPRPEYIDAASIDFTSIQTGHPGRPETAEHALELNRIAVDWIRACRNRKRRVLVVHFDEARPELDRRGWWSALLGGAGWESHVLPPYDRPLSAWEPTWTQLGGARAFMESLPFWEMEPRNDLVLQGTAFCLACPGRAYALYLPAGGSVTIALPPEGKYELAWWNPQNGKLGRFQNRRILSGGRHRLRAPGAGDWAARLLRLD